MTWSLNVVRRLAVLLVCCTVLAMFLAPAAVAADSLAEAPHFSLTPAALQSAAAAVSVPEGTTISIIELEERYSFDADGSNVYTQHMVYKVLSAAGDDEEWNELKTYWSPWREDKPQLKARVVATDGTAYALDPATIAESPAHSGDAATYSDSRVLRAPLPGFGPGAVVETEIVLRERLLFPGAGNVRRCFFQMSQPIEHSRVVLEAPDSIPLRYRLDAAPRVTTTQSVSEGKRRWVFDSAPSPANHDWLDNVAPDQFQIATLTFSTGTSWQELAQAYDKIVAERLAGANVSELATRLTRGKQGRDARAAALVDYLNREIRYTGIEFNQSSVYPHTPAETLGRRYGDCKDKALLLVALLRAADIPARLALLGVVNDVDTMPDLPGMGLFDHAIVYVPGEPALWIDATAETSRLTQLPDADRGRFSLIVDPQTTALTRIPEARSEDNVLDEIREIRLADYGPAAVTEISTPRGNFEAEYRRYYTDIRAKETVENLTDYIKSEYAAEKLGKAERSEPKDFSSDFRLTLEGTKASRGFTSLSDAVLYIPIDNLFRTLPYDFRTREPTEEENAKATRPKKKRTLDYLLSRPFSVRWRYRIVPPPGFQAAVLPAATSRRLGIAQFSEEYSLDADGAVRAEFRFDTRQRRFSPDEQRAIRNDVATLTDRESVAIKFDLKAQALLREGKARESFQQYRDLVAQHPKDPIQHLRRADALIDAGMGDAARAEVAAAIKLDPKLALARRMQAIVLQYDSIGRWHFPGADYAGAAAAYRAAIQLDHEDHALVGNYAILLEHDSRGLRYGSAADLKGAIAAYRELTKEQRAKLKIPQNLAYALFFDRQFAAALEAANELESPPLALLIAADAQVNGSAHAIAEGRRRGSSTEFSKAATAAGNSLMNLREYASAADVLEAGATGTTTAPVMSLVNILRQAKRHETLPTQDGPVSALRAGIETMITSSTPISDVEIIGSRNARAEWTRLDAETRRNATEANRMFFGSAMRASMSPDVMLDIALQAMQFRVTGDDATGFRVTIQATGMPTQNAFFVKEQGRYVQLGTEAWPVPIATEIMERIATGDRTTPAMLLAWLREASTRDGDADDPYDTRPLTRFWALGQRQGDIGALRLAAASIWVTERSSAQRGIDVLEAAKAAATGEQADAIDFALFAGYEALRDHARALALAEALAKRAPLSRRLFHARSLHLRALGRFAEADALSAQRLEALPDDIDALRALATNAAARRDYLAAYERGMKVLSDPRSTGYDLNSVAWNSLFYPREGGPDLDSAMRAGQTKDGSAWPALHTLGCVYAEIGKTVEARSVLLQSLSMRAMSEPNGDFWYAFGRIAEQYGEREVALADYARVTPPDDPSLLYQSTYELAQRRLKVLAAK